MAQVAHTTSLAVSHHIHTFQASHPHMHTAQRVAIKRSTLVALYCTVDAKTAHLLRFCYIFMHGSATHPKEYKNHADSKLPPPSTLHEEKANLAPTTNCILRPSLSISVHFKPAAPCTHLHTHLHTLAHTCTHMHAHARTCNLLRLPLQLSLHVVHEKTPRRERFRGPRLLNASKQTSCSVSTHSCCGK